MEHLTVPVEWKRAGGDFGSLTGYASTYDLDLGGDRVMPGAFAKTVAAIKAGQAIPLLADHDASTASVIGSIHDADEDDRGLRIRARFASTQRAQDVRRLLLEGHLSKLSIGYETMDDAYEDRDGMKVRLLREVKLWETSVVVFPMNPQAAATSVKVDGARGDALDLDLLLAQAEVDVTRLLLG